MNSEIEKEKANLSLAKKGLLALSFLFVVLGFVFKFSNGPDPFFFILLGCALFVVWVLVSLGGQNRVQIMELQHRVTELEAQLSVKD